MNGHLGYAFRERFALKGLNFASEDAGVFSRKDAADRLGFGTSMVKATTFWLAASGLIQKERKGCSLTALGEEIIREDRWLEEYATLWKLHINLVDNKNQLPVFYTFFRNTDSNRSYTRKELVSILKKKLPFMNEDVLRKELNVLLATYIRKDNIHDPEDNTTSLLEKLSILKESSDGIIRQAADARKLPYEIVEYILQICTEKNGSVFSINCFCEMMDLYCNANAVFSMSLLNKFENGVYRLDYTAGNNMIYMLDTKEPIYKQMELADIL